jgi:NADH-ubiquinone oxidoreductase chain 6
MYFLQDTINAGYYISLVNILSISSIISGIFVITTKNPIVSVLFLIALFFNVACFLIALGLNFIGLSYLLVYVGAVSILFLFILMLINIRVSELLNKTSNSIPLIFIVFVLLSFILFNVLPIYYNNFISGNFINSIFKTSLYSTDTFYLDYKAVKIDIESTHITDTFL